MLTNGLLSVPDVNECDEGDNACDINADCSNVNGTYFCQCQSGFTGNGFVCFGTHRLLLWHIIWLNLEDAPLVECMYLAFTRMSGESYRRRLGSLLCLCDDFPGLINSFVCCLNFSFENRVGEFLAGRFFTA